MNDDFNSPPFKLPDDCTDMREVRIVSRAYSDGEVRRLAKYMIDGGHARRYIMGYRAGWC